MPFKKDYLSSKYLRDRTMPKNIKLIIIKYSLLLFLYNAMLFHRNDKIYFIFAVLGALANFINFNIKSRFYFAIFMTFCLIWYQNPILFYLMYGFVTASTYHLVSHICLSLSTECLFYFRQIEILFLIVPCFVSFENKIVCASILFCITLLIFFCERPACEIIEKNHKCYLKDILQSIQNMIDENDYCLIVEEQRLVLRFHKNIHDTYEWNLTALFDLLMPLWFYQIDNLLKAWLFLSFNLVFKRSFYMIPVLYLSIMFDYFLVAVVVAPVMDWSFWIGKGKRIVIYTVLARLISGYVCYLLLLILN